MIKLYVLTDEKWLLLGTYPNAQKAADKYEFFVGPEYLFSDGNHSWQVRAQPYVGYVTVPFEGEDK